MDLGHFEVNGFLLLNWTDPLNRFLRGPSCCWHRFFEFLIKPLLLFLALRCPHNAAAKIKVAMDRQMPSDEITKMAEMMNLAGTMDRGVGQVQSALDQSRSLYRM